VDEKHQLGFDHIARPGLLYSPDSKRLAYAAVRGEQIIVVCDGALGPTYSNVVDIGFSADSKHVAYRAVTGQQPVVVVDSKPLPPCDAVTPVTFSPDGAHYIFAALRGISASIYVDGAALPYAYTSWMRDSRPVFASANAVDLLMARDRALLQVRVNLAGTPTTAPAAK